jgi:ribosomal protein S3AE
MQCEPGDTAIAPPEKMVYRAQQPGQQEKPEERLADGISCNLERIYPLKKYFITQKSLITNNPQNRIIKIIAG